MNNEASIRQVGEEDFELEVLKSKQAVLVAFGANWSRPCDILIPVLDEVAAECGGGLKVLKVDADDAPELSMWYDIQSIPTLLFFAGGTVHARIVGTASKKAILAKMQSILNNEPSTRETPEPDSDLPHF